MAGMDGDVHGYAGTDAQRAAALKPREPSFPASAALAAASQASCSLSGRSVRSPSVRGTWVACPAHESSAVAAADSFLPLALVGFLL